MATSQLDEKTQRAIRISLEKFKLEQLALLGIYDDEPVSGTQKVLSSPSVASSETGWNPGHDSLPIAFELGDRIPDQNDVLIAIMGATGTGKTSLVNLIAGKDMGKVGDSLQYGTGDVSPYFVSYGGINFTLIDTPGFDDCYHSDADILRKISDWLAESYSQSQKLTAILYLTRISDPRMQGSPLRNFKLFKELCGEDCYRNVVLGTTFWEATDSRHPGLAEQREGELIGEFWADMIEGGSEVMRIPESRWLARELLLRLAKKGEMTLKNQRERADPNIAVEATAASSILQETERLKAKFDEEIKQKLIEMERAREEQEQKHQHEEEARAAEFRRNLEERRKDQKRLDDARMRKEKESQLLKDEKRRKNEQAEREQIELAEQLKKVTKEKHLQERKRKRVEYSKQKQSSMTKVQVAQQMKQILATIREPHNAFMLCCDNCFQSIGGRPYYECKDDICKTSEGDNFILCKECHDASGVYCNDKAHWTTMKMLQQKDIQSLCKRVYDPPRSMGVRLCTRCDKDLDAVYFHCCACLNDEYDLCVKCVTSSQICRRQWSINGHPLNMCTRYSDAM